MLQHEQYCRVQASTQAEEYRVHAEQCEKMASAALTMEGKRAFAQAAKTWRDMARQAEWLPLLTARIADHCHLALQSETNVIAASRSE